MSFISFLNMIFWITLHAVFGTFSDSTVWHVTLKQFTFKSRPWVHDYCFVNTCKACYTCVMIRWNLHERETHAMSTEQVLNMDETCMRHEFYIIYSKPLCLIIVLYPCIDHWFFKFVLRVHCKKFTVENYGNYRQPSCR